MVSNEFPGNVFVSRNYPPPMNAEPPAPQVTVTGSESVNMSDLIDSTRAAELLGVTTNNLRQMVHKGRLTVAGKDGRKNLFSRAEVTELAGNRSK